FCSLLAPSDAILFQEGVSVKLRLPHTHLPGETIMITSLIAFFISYIRRAPVAEYQSQPATVEH
ncbi:hypothetical protein, partial [Escherichia coli]